MATWLAHLRIAEKIKERIPEIDLSYLMMGSIAPDSGEHTESDNENNPSKEITHFETKQEDECKIDLDVFFDKYLAPYKIFTRSDNTRSFLWGYYFHLIADSIWVEKYLKPNQEKYDTNEHEEKDFIDLMNEEIYALDFLYLQQKGDSIIESFKGCKPDLGFFNEFKPCFIHECQKKIVEYYENQQYILDREYAIYSLDIIEQFINEATQKCLEVLI